MEIDNEPLSKEEIEDIKKSIADIKAGRVYTLEQVKKKLRLNCLLKNKKVFNP